MEDLRENTAMQLNQLMRLARRHRHQHHRPTPWGDPQMGQGRVLALLKLKPEITQRELTYLLGTSRQSLAELLAKLEQRGFITREPSPTDGRVMLVRLTEAGAAQSQDRPWPGPVSAETLSDLSDEQVQHLQEALEVIVHRLEAELPGECEPRGGWGLRHRGHRPH